MWLGGMRVLGRPSTVFTTWDALRDRALEGVKLPGFRSHVCQTLKDHGANVVSSVNQVWAWPVLCWSNNARGACAGHRMLNRACAVVRAHCRIAPGQLPCRLAW